MRLVFDIEADNLLVEASVIWCVVAYDLDAKKWHRWEPDEIDDAYSFLMQADELIAHNGVMYDWPVLVRLHGQPEDIDAVKLTDTILLSRLLYPDKYDQPMGGHGLAEWGAYLGERKSKHTDFTQYSKAMLKYCKQDVRVTVKTYRYLMERMDESWDRAIAIEHEVAKIIAQQIEFGVYPFEDRIHELHELLDGIKSDIDQQLVHAVPPETKTYKTPAYWYGTDKRGRKQRERTKGALQSLGVRDCKRGPNRTATIPFNPNSNDRFIEFLVDKYNWKPKVHTDSGKPKLDETILDGLDYPEAKLLKRRRLFKSRIDKVAGWLTFQSYDGAIHGNVITNGAVTGRMSHSSPNFNIPRVNHDDDGNPIVGEAGKFGYESRRCFGPPDGWVQVGIDASGMQLRALAHALAPFDGGRYSNIAVTGDPHQVNADAMGTSRSIGKNCFYGLIFGAGDEKTGQTAYGKEARSKAEYIRKGKLIRKRIRTGIKGMDKMLTALESQIKRKGYIVGLDGRKIKVRHSHTGLNTKLQSDEAIVMKVALCLLYRRLTQVIGRHGDEWAFMLNIHDEWQLACKPEHAELIGKTGVQAIRKAGKILDFKCRLDGEYKIGKDWSECH